MGDFKQVIQWLKEGKKVRNPSYVGGFYMSIKGIGLIGSNGQRTSLSISDFERTDWEVYENSGEFLQRLGTDGDLWAREFIRINGDEKLDVDIMRGWFCNAIEAGRSAK